MSLSKALGKVEIPSVKDFSANVEDNPKIVGSFAQAVNKKLDFVAYFLVSEVDNIDANPDKYVIKYSANKKAYFIVPDNGNGSGFNVEDFK